MLDRFLVSLDSDATSTNPATATLLISSETPSWKSILDCLRHPWTSLGLLPHRTFSLSDNRHLCPQFLPTSRPPTRGHRTNCRIELPPHLYHIPFSSNLDNLEHVPWCQNQNRASGCVTTLQWPPTTSRIPQWYPTQGKLLEIYKVQDLHLHYIHPSTLLWSWRQIPLHQCPHAEQLTKVWTAHPQ